MAPSSTISPTSSSLTLQGTIAAAVLAGVSALIGAIWLAGGVSRDIAGMSLAAGGIVGAAIGMAVFWRLLVPRGGTYSIAYSLLAGLLAAVAAHALAWVSLFIAGSLQAADSLPDLAQAFGFTVSMMGMSMILAGTTTIPAGIVIALAVTVWCRWQRGLGR